MLESKFGYFTGKTKKEVLNKIDEYKSSLITGSYVEPNKLTVKDWLTTWLETYKKSIVSPKTYDEAEYHCLMHLIPSIGDLKIQSLRTEDIQKMYNSNMKVGRKMAQGGYQQQLLSIFTLPLSKL